ncbi:MAG TPA: signal peptidase II [Thermoleophilia bacterium]|nr:signal peptidase II [Thermoleophilia bacterium]
MREGVDRGPVLILRESSRPSLKWMLAGTTLLVALTADLALKALVRVRLDVGVFHELLPGVGLQHVQNTGVAFGLFAGQSVLIIAAPLISVIVILAYIALETRTRLAGLAGGLLLGGSLGNLVERVGSGEVTDFIRLPYWPNFNLADIFIVAGVALVAAGILFSPAQGEGDREGGSAAAGAPYVPHGTDVPDGPAAPADPGSRAGSVPPSNLDSQD